MLLTDYFVIIAGKLWQSTQKGKIDHFMQTNLSSELQMLEEKIEAQCIS